MKQAFLCIVFSALFLALFSLPHAAFSQNVGIGTATPTFKLDVNNGSINTDSVYRIRGNKILSANLQNTFVGIGAANSITTGNFNTAVGYETLKFSTTAGRNTATGSFALKDNTTGDYNTANGSSALSQNTTGDYNTANGFNALTANATGQFNTANGSLALDQNRTGDYNTANGFNALTSNYSASNNTAIGANSLELLDGAYNDNTAIGANSGTDMRFGAGNTYVGSNSGLTMDLGSNNTFVGKSSYLVGSPSNYGAFGFFAGGSWSTASNRIEIGNTSITNIGGQVGWSTLSDVRLKNNIKEDVPGLSFIKLLKPITYNLDIHKQETLRKEQTNGVGKLPETDWEGRYDIERIKFSGFSAQGVLEAAKSVGYDFSGVDVPKDGGLMSLRYAEFVVPLVKAVQEQQRQITDLKTEIDLLKEQNKILMQLLNKKN